MTRKPLSFSNSEQYLDRSLKTIPLGSQTFSKSKLCYPYKVSPLFLESGVGATVVDPDGNEYLDFVNGLLCVLLGYGDTDVLDAVTAQLHKGVTLSLPHKLEFEVAELLTELVPCAEMVRFGKNGSDATSAAIRLARAFTKRERVAVCGYHGWQDWYIGSTTRDLGVPESTKALTHTFKYNDISSLEVLLKQHTNQFAAVIMEPMNVDYPAPDYLNQVKQLCQQHGTLLVFDETITGFRFDIGGAQRLFDVKPDLATFGKGMANGFPISAVVGRRDVMMLMEDIFYSGTFGGELLSLAAAKATMTKLKQQNVLSHIHQMGEKLIAGLNQIITKHDAQDLFSVSGHPSWSFLLMGTPTKVTSQQLSSLMQQEMHQRGLLCGSAHNLSFAHQAEHIERLLQAYDEIIPLALDVSQNGGFEAVFRGVETQPVFKVR